MSFADYKANRRGMQEMLNSDMMETGMGIVALAIMRRAEEIAPIGPATDPHRGRYKGSFAIRSHKNGGATHDRAEAIVSNFAPEALYVEFGTEGREPYHTLLRAATETRI